MNTSGPSSRPRHPYPLALLNHLTVPCKRSTRSPLFFAGFPEKARFQEPAKNCVRIVLLTGGAVKDCNHTGLPGGRLRDGRDRCRAGISGCGRTRVLHQGIAATAKTFSARRDGACPLPETRQAASLRRADAPLGASKTKSFPQPLLPCRSRHLSQP